MQFCHRHNLVEPEKAGIERRFGIKVSLPANDTFSAILGETWERIHWYATEQQRDEAYQQMAQRHGYYRDSDTPSQTLIKIVK